MPLHRFSPGAQFMWQKVIGAKWITYVLDHADGATHHVHLRDVLTGETAETDLAVLTKAFFDGQIQFASLVKPAGRQRAAGDASLLPNLDDYPEPLPTIARYRLSVIKPLLEKSPRERTRAAVEARVCEIQSAQSAGEKKERSLSQSVSVASVYRWIKAYTQSGNDLRALMPGTHRRGGKDRSRLEPATETILRSTIQDLYLPNRETTTAEDVLNEVAVRLRQENAVRGSSEQLSLPAPATAARRIEDLDDRATYEAKHGRRAARREFAQYGKTNYPTTPLDRVEIDHTPIDVILVDDEDLYPLGRATLTYCLDIATRYPLGYYLGFEPPSYLTVMECLYHAIRPKNTPEMYGTKHNWLAYGMPFVLVIDNGKEFIGKDLEDACELLGTTLQQTPVKTPHFKAGIERQFGSTNTMFLHTLPGTTFSNVQKRGDYDSLREARLTLGELDKALNIFVVDFYAERFHEGLNGIPARRWEDAAQRGFTPNLPNSAKDLAIKLGRVEWRTIQPYGIDLETLRYNCDELAVLRRKLKRQSVKIKYHPTDLGRIFVYDPFDERYIEVPALDAAYANGLSLWAHRVIRNFVLHEKGTVDRAQLGEAKREIRSIVAAAKQRKRKLTTRKNVARWESGDRSANSSNSNSANSSNLPTLGEATTPKPVAEISSADKPALPAPSDTLALPSIPTPDPDWEIVYLPASEHAQE